MTGPKDKKDTNKKTPIFGAFVDMLNDLLSVQRDTKSVPGAHKPDDLLHKERIAIKKKLLEGREGSHVGQFLNGKTSVPDTSKER